MVFVPAVRTVECAIKYDVIGQECINTLYFRRADAWGPSTMTSLCNILSSWVIANLLPKMSIQARFTSIHARDLSSANGFVLDVAAPGGSVGGDASEAIPLNASCAITFRTNLAGRSYRGRNFIVGIPQTATQDSRVDNAYLNDITTAYQLLPSLVDAAGAEQVIVSRYSGYTFVDGKKKPTPRATAVITNVTQHYFVDNVIDSQRRRLPGRGR